MKKIFFLFSGLLLLNFSFFSQSQVNLIIFSEDGDPFFAYINGVKQNNTPETNVRFTNLSPNISLRIEFENKALPQLKQTMALEAGQEHTARIKRDAKKQLKLRYFGSVPLNEASVGINTVEYHTAENALDNTSYPSEPNSSVSSTTVTQSSSNQNPGTISVTMPGINIQVNGIDPNYHSTTSSTLTQSSSSESSYTSSSNYSDDRSSSSRNNTCRVAMNAGSFAKMQEAVESKSFSETKLSTAKVATQNACLSVNQIKTIAGLFSMDADRLTYAKFAYDRCVDKANYYQVSEVFKFSSTTDELNEFLTH